MTTAIRQAPHHRTLTCYTNYGCRLPDCVERYRANERKRRQEKNRGLYQRYADAAPVRTHVLQLVAAGASTRGIARRASVSDRVVRELLPTRPDGTRTPLKYRVLAVNADKLLALTAADVIPHYTPAIGTIRRIQANVADGWPMNRVAEEVGLFPSYVSNLLWRAETLNDLQVRGTTALNVARGYDTLRGRRPLRSGISRKAHATAKRIGASRQWPTTRYWDQFPGAIDDPDFEPLYGVTKREIVAQDAHWVMTTNGLDRASAAARLGVSKAYIDHAFRDHPQYAVEVAA
ncbi:hypothetical protein [Streptomyces tendae]|uniref:hypothetical protein n=1 Tax=Streptomyces tendae TaxID=1932 RepID=UPI003D721FC1